MLLLLLDLDHLIVVIADICSRKPRRINLKRFSPPSAWPTSKPSLVERSERCGSRRSSRIHVVAAAVVVQKTSPHEGRDASSFLPFSSWKLRLLTDVRVSWGNNSIPGRP